MRRYVIKTRSYSEIGKIRELLDEEYVIYNEYKLEDGLPYINFDFYCTKETWKLIKKTLGLEVTTVVSQFKREES